MFFYGHKFHHATRSMGGVESKVKGQKPKKIKTLNGPKGMKDI